MSTPPPGDLDLWDVAVIGAGPAGATAARVAASAGARVLVLERAALPRYKTCGGGLVGASIAALPPRFRPPTQGRIDAIRFTLNGRWSRLRRSPTPLFDLVFRDEFDAALTAAATANGAVLRDGVSVNAITAEPDSMLLRLADGQQVRARAVVGADGSASRTGGYVGVRCDQVDLGLEAEIPVDAATAARWRGQVLIDWGPLPGSYGWVFPKGEVLTTGVIAARGQGERTRAYLRALLERLGLAGIAPLRESGHLTRCRRPGSPLWRERVLVAGDAAGLLEPWTREGISYALRSGALAGAAAASLAVAGTPEAVRAAGEAYTSAVRETLGAEMDAGRRMLAAFARRPGLFHAAVTMFPPAWHTFIGVVRGQTTLPATLRNPVARRALARLAPPLAARTAGVDTPDRSSINS